MIDPHIRQRRVVVFATLLLILACYRAWHVYKHPPPRPHPAAESLTPA